MVHSFVELYTLIHYTGITKAYVAQIFREINNFKKWQHNQQKYHFYFYCSITADLSMWADTDFFLS